MSDLIWALAAAAILAILGVMLAKPRAALITWLRGLSRRVRLRLYLQQREATARAIERMAVLLASRENQSDGNPDDKFFSDKATPVAQRRGGRGPA